MKIASRIATVLALGASAPSASAGEGDLKPRLYGEIRGRVVEVRTQRPLHYANVTIVGTRLRTMTQKDGTFRIAEVPPGVYSIKVNAMAYRSIEGKGVRVGLGRTTTIPVDLALEINYCCQKKRVVVVDLDDSVRLKSMLSGTLEPRLPPPAKEDFGKFRYGDSRSGWIYQSSEAPWAHRKLPLTLDEVRSRRSDELRAERDFAQWTEVWKTRSGLR